jgi:hypothetical protein
MNYFQDCHSEAQQYRARNLLSAGKADSSPADPVRNDNNQEIPRQAEAQIAEIH